MARDSRAAARWTTGVAAAAVIAASLPALGRELLDWPMADRVDAPTAAPAPAGQGGGGRRGGRGGVGATVFTLADGNKDGSLTRAELRTTLEQWSISWDRTNASSLTADQVRAGALSVFPVTPQNQTPNPAQVEAMIAALPERAPATPKQPRRVLVLARSTGFVHATIPLAARTVEELGKKTGAWSTVVTYDAADINAANLLQFDAIFLASTTGHFVDDAVSAAATAARRQALLDFVHNGRGLAGVHAASDSYHTGTETAEAQAAAAMDVARALLARDTNRDGRLSRPEFSAAADAWFETIDTTKTGTIAQADFAPRFATLLAGTQPARGGRGQGPSNAGTWPEWNRMIGGSFLAHPWQHVWVKIDDPASPITAPFKGETFEITDETYTFTRESFSRDNVRVLLSIDVSRMTPEDLKRENRPWDHDYALSWIRADGKGRVFYAAHGHEPRIYAMRPMLEHYLAGIQYAIGDLPADDRPRPAGK
jgi:type 1 glutamine amidotransferase